MGYDIKMYIKIKGDKEWTGWMWLRTGENCGLL